MKKKYLILFIISMILFIIPGCLVLESKYGSERVYKIIKGSKISESTLKIKINRDGEKIGELRSKLISPAVIIGDIIEDQTGDINFVVHSIKYLSNWSNGWTEGESSASGNFMFYKENNSFKVKINEDFEIWEVINGEIRYKDNYYKDEAGYKKVKSRMLRVTSLIDYLKTQEYVDFPDFFGHARLKTSYGKSFKKITQPFLFPETIDIDKLKRKNQLPVDYDIPVGLKGDLVFSEGFFWRKSYTEKFFPDYLWQSRNSASIWRDYEEAIHLFFMIYNIDYYFNNVLKNASFIRVK